MREDFQPAVYLLASAPNGTLYVGVTSDLIARIHQHRTGAVPGFTRDYGVKLLVWFEQHATMDSAITREKRIKKWNRAWNSTSSKPAIRTGETSPRISVSLRSVDCSLAGFPPSRE